MNDIKLGSVIYFLNKLEELGKEMGLRMQVDAFDSTQSLVVYFLDKTSHRLGTVLVQYDKIYNYPFPEAYAKVMFDKMLRNSQ